MQQVPRPIGGCLHLHAKAGPGTGWAIGLQFPNLIVLKTPEDPPGLAFLEIAFLVPFDGQNPSSSYKVRTFLFSHIYEIKYFVFIPPGFAL
tara:strand:+ start:337 stop:609 length:273 start_codon:yes stop_codon:yes gene_type:complete